MDTRERALRRTWDQDRTPEALADLIVSEVRQGRFPMPEDPREVEDGFASILHRCEMLGDEGSGLALDKLGLMRTSALSGNPATAKWRILTLTEEIFGKVDFVFSVKTLLLQWADEPKFRNAAAEGVTDYLLNQGPDMVVQDVARLIHLQGLLNEFADEIELIVDHMGRDAEVSFALADPETWRRVESIPCSVRTTAGAVIVALCFGPLPHGFQPIGWEPALEMLREAYVNALLEVLG